MFKKSLLAMLISASFTSSVIYAAEEVATSSEEVMVVSGEYLNYKSDSNKGSMRMEMTQLETPGQVNVIDSQIIEEQRASTLGEVLKNDSSVSAEGNSRNRERFSLRGFQLSSSTGYLRDGKQHWSHYRQPVELLESVEVLKGPSSLLYGQSAPGGLINMVTKKPTAATHFTLTQDVGSDNEMKSTLDVSGALNEDKTLRSRLILSKQSYDSWRSYSDGSSPSTDRFVGGLVVDYDVNDAITVSAHYDRTRDDGGVDTGAYVINDVSVISDNYIWDTQWSNIDNDVQNIGFDVDVRLNDNWSLNTSYNYQDFERHDVESYADETSYDETTGTYDQNGSDRRDNWVFQTASVDLMGQFNTGSIEHQVLIGTNWLGYRYDRLQYTLNTSTTTVGEPNASASIDETGRVTDTNSTYDAYGFYVQDMMTLNEQWQVLAGLRYDIKVTPGDSGESDEKLDAIVPKLAVIYHPTNNGSVYLTYSESFEPQSDVSDSDAINDGSSLDPVTGILYELGTKWELFDDQLFASAAVFEITEENTTINVDQGTSGLYEVTQAGERVHRGVEVALQGSVTDALSVAATGTYLDAKYTSHEEYEGNRPADVPEFSASIWSTYQLMPNTDVNLGAIYVGSRYGDTANTFKKDAYTRFDLGLSHTFQYDQNLAMTLRFNVENLLDTDYYAGGGTTGDDYASNGARDVVVGEGRNYMATIQVKY